MKMPHLVTRPVKRDQIDHVATGRLHQRARESLKISRRKFAIVMGFTNTYVGQLELGQRAWDAGLSLAYIRALKLVDSGV